MTGKEGAIAEFFWEIFFRIKYFFEWFGESGENAKAVTWAVIVLVVVYALVFMAFGTNNPFRVYQIWTNFPVLVEFDACERKIAKARKEGDAGKIREILAICEKNAEYIRIENYRKAHFLQYESCKKKFSAAQKKGDLMEIGKIHGECRSNSYFLTWMQYPEYNPIEYRICFKEQREKMEKRRGIPVHISETGAIADFCFKKHSGPRKYMHNRNIDG